MSTRCSRHPCSSLSKRDRTAKDSRLACGHAWRDDLHWIYLCKLDRGCVLFCTSCWSPVADSSCHSGCLACAACCGDFVLARITKMAYVSLHTQLACVSTEL